jgi:hypothetical protein
MFWLTLSTYVYLNICNVKFETYHGALVMVHVVQLLTYVPTYDNYILSTIKGGKGMKKGQKIETTQLLCNLYNDDLRNPIVPTIMQRQKIYIHTYIHIVCN